MKTSRIILTAALLSILAYGIPSAAQQAKHGEQAAHQQAEERHDAKTGEAEHAEEHGGRPHHQNDVAVFLGVTDEHGHDSEFTWGIDRLPGLDWVPERD